MATQQSSETTHRRTRETGQEQDRPSGQAPGEQWRGSRSVPQPSMANMTAIAVRGFGQVYDMQMAAARMFLRTQARAAAVFGVPDYSDFFHVGDDRSRHVFSSATDHLLHASQRASETFSEIQRHIGRLMESNALNMSESWRGGFEEFAAQAEQGLQQLQELARQQADEAVRTAESFGEAARETLRQSGEDIRDTLRQGAEHGRELASEQAEAMRAAGERAAGQARGEEPETERGGRRSRAA